jgi:hypothetical protein
MRTIKDALADGRWIADDMDTQTARELVGLWARLAVFELQENIEDKFTWPCSPTGCTLQSLSMTDYVWAFKGLSQQIASGSVVHI